MRNFRASTNSTPILNYGWPSHRRRHKASATATTEIHAECSQTASGRSTPQGLRRHDQTLDLTSGDRGLNASPWAAAFEIALACDIIVESAENASSHLPSRGSPGGRRRRNAAAVAHDPLKKARADLTGRRVSAKEGYELGFVTSGAARRVLTGAPLASSIRECSPMVGASHQAGRHARAEVRRSDGEPNSTTAFVADRTRTL